MYSIYSAILILKTDYLKNYNLLHTSSQTIWQRYINMIKLLLKVININLNEIKRRYEKKRIFI